jgi:hypothetical protein
MGLLAQFFRHKDASPEQDGDVISLGAVAAFACVPAEQRIPAEIAAKPEPSPPVILAPRVLHLVPGAPPPIFLTPLGTKPPVLPSADSAQ